MVGTKSCHRKWVHPTGPKRSRFGPRSGNPDLVGSTADVVRLLQLIVTKFPVPLCTVSRGYFFFASTHICLTAAQQWQEGAFIAQFLHVGHIFSNLWFGKLCLLYRPGTCPHIDWYRVLTKPMSFNSFQNARSSLYFYLTTVFAHFFRVLHTSDQFVKSWVLTAATCPV